jgi:hypothetical protein
MNQAQVWQVTPAQYAAMEAEVNAAGFPISGGAGWAEVTKYGLTAKIGWTYDGAKLSITVLDAPMFCTGMVEGKIADAVNQALVGA